MKIQLDFDAKLITVENNVNLGEFVKKIKRVLPDWKEWDITSNTVINNWGYYPIYRWDDYWPTTILATGGTLEQTTVEMQYPLSNNGTVCIEV